MTDDLARSIDQGVALSEPELEGRLRLLLDGDLERFVRVADLAATVNRLAHIQRGRRTVQRKPPEKIAGPDPTISNPEKAARSKERVVAEWFESALQHRP